MTVYDVINGEIQRLSGIRLPVGETEACDAIRAAIGNLSAVREAFDAEAERQRKENSSAEAEGKKEAAEDVQGGRNDD